LLVALGCGDGYGASGWRGGGEQRGGKEGDDGDWGWVRVLSTALAQASGGAHGEGETDGGSGRRVGVMEEDGDGDER